MDPSKQSIRPLTSLRFFAALAVFFYHIAYFTRGTRFSSFVGSFFDQGFTGVAFFFILSGFILAHNYRTRFSAAGGKSVRDFYVSRFARVYPTHFLFFVFSWPLMGQVFLEFPAKTFVKGLSQLFLVQSYFPSTVFSQTFNPVSWSISDEFFFYALFPFISMALCRIGWRRARAWFAAAAGIWFAAVATVFLFRELAVANWLFYFFPGFRLVDFVLGILLYHVFWYARPHLEEKGVLFFTLLEIIALALMAAAFSYSGNIHTAYKWGVYFMPCMGLVVFVFSLSGGHLSGFLSNPLLVWGGEISYSFYMSHILILQYMERQWPGVFSRSPGLAAAGAFLAILAVSYLSYRYFEVPMRRLIKERFI